MPRGVERPDRFQAAVARVGRVEPGPGTDGDVDGDVAAGGGGRVYEEDVIPVRGRPDVPGVDQPEEHSISHVYIAGENVEEARGGGAEVDREEASNVARAGENGGV